jgi:hypothetical protein
VEAVLAAERALGRRPLREASINPGYDILSRDLVSGPRYFIKVKGRVRGAETAQTVGAKRRQAPPVRRLRSQEEHG